MLLKIHGLTWFLGLPADGILYLTGNLNSIVQIVFGLLTFVAVFM